MADKNYELTFALSDGSKKSVQFTAPQGPQGPQGTPGSTGEDGYTPQKGVDYFTDADKDELVAAVLGALPAAEEEAF